MLYLMQNYNFYFIVSIITSIQLQKFWKSYIQVSSYGCTDRWLHEKSNSANDVNRFLNESLLYR